MTDLMNKTDFIFAIAKARVRHPTTAVVLTVYAKPPSHPKKFVVKMTHHSSNRIVKTNVEYVSLTLDDVLAAIPGKYFTKLPSSVDDDKTVVGAWV